jgi:hypothetical protein
MIYTKKKNIIYSKYNNKYTNKQSKTLNNKTKSIINKTKDKQMQSKTSKDKDYTLLKPKKDSDIEWVYKYYNEDEDDTIINNKSKSKSQSNKVSRCMCINYKDVNDFKSYDRCPRNAINNTNFCELHQECKSYLRNFMSGDEPEYKPKQWAEPYVEGSHNCYSYFLNRQVKAVKEKCEEICLKKHKKSCPKKDSECSDLKPQPGDYKLLIDEGTDKNKKRIYQCPNMQKKILADNPSLIPVSFDTKCPANYYKGAMVVHPTNTYHFYRQNKDGTFSHKPGISKVSNVDSSGNPIYIPHFADRNYEEDEDNDEAINYTNFCGYYCVPQNHIVHKNLA